MERNGWHRGTMMAAIFSFATMIIITIFVIQSLSSQQKLTVQEQYDNCLRSNETREGLRGIVDHIVPENQPDLSGIQDPGLRALIPVAQANNKQWREDQLKKYMPRDCEAERESLK